MAEQMPAPETGLFYESLVLSYLHPRRFVARPWLAERIDTAMRQPHCRFVLLTAEPGAGKTAFMAWLADQHQDWPRYFIRRDQRTPLGDVGAHSLLLQIGLQLAAYYPDAFRREHIKIAIEQRVGASSGQVIGAEIDKLVASPFYQKVLDIQQSVAQNQGSVVGLKIREWITEPRQIPTADLQYMALIDPARILHHVQPHQRLVVLIDALDELRYRPHGDSLLDWLSQCPELPANLRIVLTARNDDAFLATLRGAQQPWLQEEMIPEQGHEVQGDLTEYAGKLVQEPAVQAVLSTQAQREQFVRDAVSKANGNLGYLDALGRALDQAVMTSNATLLTQLLALQQLPETLQELYGYFLHLIQNGVSQQSVVVQDTATRRQHFLPAWPAVYYPILGVLAAAREPLSQVQIRRLGGIAANASYVAEAMGRLRQFLNQVDDGYRLYHTTLPEFLVAESTRQDSSMQELAIEPAVWHSQIVSSYRGTAADWDQVNWGKVDEYGLRHLVAHVYALQAAPDSRQALHALVQCKLFYQQRLARGWNSQPVLQDVRQALTVALQDDDLVQAWRHVGLYRKISRNEQDFQKLQDAVRASAYQEALERTDLYAYLPNSQALARLWLAWEAVANGRQDVAHMAAHRALTSLPPRGIVSARAMQLDETAQDMVTDAMDETLQRLLVRITRAAAPNDGARRTWLSQVADAWPPDQVQRVTSRLTEPTASWGGIFASQGQDMPLDMLLVEIQEQLHHTDQGANFRAASYLYHHRLAASLFNSRHQEGWSAYVQQAVDLISLDDYPSYREMALAWVAIAVLAHEDDAQARSALATVLTGAFRQTAPGFWGDTIAAALDGQAQEGLAPLDPKALFASLHMQAGLDGEPSRPQQPDSVRASRPRTGLPPDPWSYNMRRRSAVAAAWYPRQPHIARTWLAEAGLGDPDESYAGFRALARLSLACRWLEWGHVPQAEQQIEAARHDAAHMLDAVLRQERFQVIARVQRWLVDFQANPADVTGAGALRQARALTGMEQLLYCEFLAATGAADLDRLRTLVLLALDDATTTDAVLGRLLRGAAGHNRPGIAFGRLVETMRSEGLVL